MNYQEFCEDFKRRVLGSKRWNIREEDYHFFPKGYAEWSEFVRDTNKTYFHREADTLLGDFALVTVRIDGEIAGNCRFLLNTLYTQYQSNGWSSIMALVDQNYKAVKASRFNDVAKMLNDYDKVKDHLILRPLNYTEHREALQDAIYRLHGDIALVLYYVLSDDGKDLNTCKMRKEQLEWWQKDTDEVLNNALNNTQMLALPRLYLNAMEVTNPPYQKGAFMALGSDVRSIKPHEVPLLTTTRKLNGAIAIFYPGVLKRISQLFGNKSFFVAFTSIDDARIHCKGSISPVMIRKQLNDLKQTFGEVLSDKVYFYDCRSEIFGPLD